MRAVTLNETRRLTPRDIRRQKRRTSPTSIIMYATFEKEKEMEKDEEKETAFCVQSLYRRVLFHGSYLPTYPLNKEPLRRAESWKSPPSPFLSLYGLRCRCLLFLLSLSLSLSTYFSRRGGFRANSCIFTKATRAYTRYLPTRGLSSLPVVIHYGWPRYLPTAIAAC